MGEQRLRVLRQSLKRCCTRSSWLAGTDIVLIGCPPSTVEWTADDTNSFSKIHAALPKGHPCSFTSSNKKTRTSAPHKWQAWGSLFFCSDKPSCVRITNA